MTAFTLTYKPYGEQSILIEWPHEINEKVLTDVLKFKNSIKSSDIKEIVEVKSAYNSILVSYNTTIDDIYDEISDLKTLYSTKITNDNTRATLWKIPVCYDTKFALDLDYLAQENNSDSKTIIQLHTAAIYTLYFIGFLPGFLYLGGLHKDLYFPRKSTPRLKVEKGAVGIGGKQTGIYPNESPGGWNIIGNSPIDFFNVHQEPPCFAKAGDRIQFYTISIKQYNDIKAMVEAGVYLLESEVLND